MIWPAEDEPWWPPVGTWVRVIHDTGLPARLSGGPAVGPFIGLDSCGNPCVRATADRNPESGWREYRLEDIQPDEVAKLQLASLEGL